MNEPDASGNKTVFRPSPLQALKAGGQAATPSPPPPSPPPAPPAAAPVAPTINTGTRWQTPLIIVFVVVTLLSLGYVALQLTGRPAGVAAGSRTSLIDGPFLLSQSRHVAAKAAA